MFATAIAIAKGKKNNEVVGRTRLDEFPSYCDALSRLQGLQARAHRLEEELAEPVENVNENAKRLLAGEPLVDTRSPDNIAAELKIVRAALSIAQARVIDAKGLAIFEILQTLKPQHAARIRRFAATLEDLQRQTSEILDAEEKIRASGISDLPSAFSEADFTGRHFRKAVLNANVETYLRTLHARFGI